MVVKGKIDNQISEARISKSFLCVIWYLLSFFLSEHNFYAKKYRENKRHCLRIVFIFIDLQLSSLHTPRCVIINVSDFLFYVSVKVKSNLMKCESIFISLVKQRQLFILIMESIFCGILIFIVCLFLYFEFFLFKLSLF